MDYGDFGNTETSLLRQDTGDTNSCRGQTSALALEGRKKYQELIIDTQGILEVYGKNREGVTHEDFNILFHVSKCLLQ